MAPVPQVTGRRTLKPPGRLGSPTAMLDQLPFKVLPDHVEVSDVAGGHAIQRAPAVEKRCRVGSAHPGIRPLPSGKRMLIALKIPRR